MIEQLLTCEGNANKPYSKKLKYNIEITSLAALKNSKSYLKHRIICYGYIVFAQQI